MVAAIATRHPKMEDEYTILITVKQKKLDAS